jgi:hypothetical protein
MNRQLVISNLREAAEELAGTIRELETTPDYGYGEFSVAMRHLYHHLNTAWNARDASAERAAMCSEEDFNAWRKFPEDLLLP